MLNALKHQAFAVGEFMSGIARKIGVKRGAVALGIAAGGLGTMLLVRATRAR